MSNNYDSEKLEYEAIGVICSSSDPEIINGYVLQDNETGCRFRASLLEAKELVSKGKLIIPKI